MISHYSASSLKMFKQCKLSWYAAKVLEIPQPPPHPLTLVGSAVHKAFEDSMEDHDAMAKVKTSCEEYGLEDPELIGRVEELTKVCEDWGWWSGVDTLDKCISEQKFSVEAEEGINLLGFIDRLDIRGQSATILDIKTQAKKFSRDELRNNLQASFYNIGARSLYDIKGPIRVEFWVLRHEIQTVTKTEADARRDLAEIIKYCKQANQYAAEGPPSASSGSHCRWCAYMQECPEWT